MMWRELFPAPGLTHHRTSSGQPAYAARFDEVLKFHAPGLAPVRCGDEAWHINVDGTTAYTRRFVRTFGFYEGLAAVTATDGWHHVHPDGTDLYASRYDWCGNYQGGRCTVRERDGSYLHLAPDGSPAYNARWKYAGDFRDGVGVVQSGDGRSTHINCDGEPMHGRWFLDLDVFHKGFARARDDAGWMHVDVSGAAIYDRRFAGVEPFYNGQARVERMDGGLDVIDEAGRQVVELRASPISEFASLSADLVGFWKTQAICAAVEAGIFEALPRGVAGIAEHCELNPRRTLRMLRALGDLRLVHSEGDRWHATRRGMYLSTQSRLTLADAATEYGRRFPAMWAQLSDALGAESKWAAPDIFGDVASDSQRIVGHHRMLLSYALHDYAGVPDVLGLRGDERVIDAGGGVGGMAGLLVDVYPALSVTILERPEVAALTKDVGLGKQVDVRVADLFQPWPVKAEAVLLARVLHDWPTPKAQQLLHHARSSLQPGGRVFIVEMLIPEDGFAGALCDLHLLVATGGAERSLLEYRALLDAAGFDLEGVRELDTVPSVIIGVAR